MEDPSSQLTPQRIQPWNRSFICLTLHAERARAGCNLISSQQGKQQVLMDFFYPNPLNLLNLLQSPVLNRNMEDTKISNTFCMKGGGVGGGLSKSLFCLSPGQTWQPTFCKFYVNFQLPQYIAGKIQRSNTTTGKGWRRIQLIRLGKTMDLWTWFIYIITRFL